MDLSAEKIDIIQRICEIQDNDILDIIKKIIIRIPDPKHDWWDEISHSEKNTINRGLKDLKEGRVQSHAAVRRKYEKWLKD